MRWRPASRATCLRAARCSLSTRWRQPRRKGRPTVHSHSGMATRVYLEIGKRRVFASAADWPGWTRAGKDEETALEALAAATSRYAAVANAARIAFAPSGGFTIVERLPGDATTEFGAPGAIAKAESRRVAQKEARRLSALVFATRTVFHLVVDWPPGSPK